MFRKLLLSTVTSVAVLSPLAVTPKAEAHEYHHSHCYRVYYRASCNRPWCFGGEYHRWQQAERAAENYRCRGFEVVLR
jgi:hypothetical protein